jgi:hypothetical protein
MTRPDNSGPSIHDRLTDLVDGLLGVAFLGLAAWFIYASPPATVPLADAATVSRSQIVPGPRRTASGVPPTTMVGGFSHNCNDCHRLFTSPPMLRRELMQHEGILLNHGLNNRCFNCHDSRDRERLVLMDGSTLSFAETPRLCAQCHGTVYRDWQRGTHGKTLGSWDAASGRQRRLQCNECHDPHAPAYQPIPPLPGPNTLRMGDQSEFDGHAGRHVPLQRQPAVHEPVHNQHEEAPR